MPICATAATDNTTFSSVLWLLLGLVGFASLVYGFVMICVVVMKANYRGKMTINKAIMLVIIGILLGSSGVYFSSMSVHPNVNNIALDTSK
jgi:hypothetical protein